MRNTFLLALLALFCVLPLTNNAQAQNPENWTVRCQDLKDSEDQHCEMFQRLVMKDSGQRLLEFAIGIPPGEKTPRGVVVMPLGILLEPGVQLMVDDTNSFKFDVRFCDNGGCVAYLRLNDAVLNAMRRGNEGKIVFTLQSYQKANIPFSLSGFSKAYSEID